MKRTKIIQVILHYKGQKTLTSIVMKANTIERVIADIQELYPKIKASMENIIMWKFITQEEADEILKTIKPIK